MTNPDLELQDGLLHCSAVDQQGASLLALQNRQKWALPGLGLCAGNLENLNLEVVGGHAAHVFAARPCHRWSLCRRRLDGRLWRAEALAVRSDVLSYVFLAGASLWSKWCWSLAGLPFAAARIW